MVKTLANLDWSGKHVLAFAPGPSLSALWYPNMKSKHPKIVVNDAWRLVRDADVLYAADKSWWYYHWDRVCHYPAVRVMCRDQLMGVETVKPSGDSGFDPTPGRIRTGCNSGYQAVHLAVQLGAKRVVLVGYDMRKVNGKAHFFGDHPKGFNALSTYEVFVRKFKTLADALKVYGVSVVNATPGSALDMFPFVKLGDEL